MSGLLRRGGLAPHGTSPPVITVNETVVGVSPQGPTVAATFATAPTVLETIVACLGSTPGGTWNGPSAGPLFGAVTSSQVNGYAGIFAATGDGATKTFTFACTPPANLLTPADATLEAGTPTWKPNTNCTVAVDPTGPAHTGTHSLLVTPVANGSDMVASTAVYQVAQLSSYTVSAWSLSAGTGRSFLLNFQWFQADGTFISSSTSTSVTDSSAAYVQKTATFTSPQSCAFLAVGVIWATPSEAHHIDDITLAGPQPTTSTLTLMRVSGLGGPQSNELAATVTSAAGGSGAAFAPGTSTTTNELWVANLAPTGPSTFAPTGLAYSNGFASALTTVAGATAATAGMVGTKIVAATGDASTAAAWSHPSAAFEGVFAAFSSVAAANGANTVPLVLNMMNQPNDFAPGGVPSSQGGSAHPGVFDPNNVNQVANVIGWGKVYRASGTQVAPNVGVEVGRIYVALWSNSTAKWVIAQTQVTVDGAYYVEDFFGNGNLPPVFNPHFVPTSGAVYVEMSTATTTTPDGTEGYNFHFWPHGGQVGIVAATGVALTDIGALFVTYQCRLIVSNPTGPDNRAQAVYVANCGADWWKADQSALFEVMESRYKLLTSNWQSVSAYTGGPFNTVPAPPAWTEAQLIASPPPLNAAGLPSGT